MSARLTQLHLIPQLHPPINVNCVSHSQGWVGGGAWSSWNPIGWSGEVPSQLMRWPCSSESFHYINLSLVNSISSPLIWDSLKTQLNPGWLHHLSGEWCGLVCIGVSISSLACLLVWRVFWFTARCLWNVLNWKQAWLLSDSSFLPLLKKARNEVSEGMLTSNQSRKLIHRKDSEFFFFLERLTFSRKVIIWRAACEWLRVNQTRWPAKRHP